MFSIFPDWNCYSYIQHENQIVALVLTAFVEIPNMIFKQK